MKIALQNMCEANSDETIRGAHDFFSIVGVPPPGDGVNTHQKPGFYISLFFMIL